MRILTNSSMRSYQICPRRYQFGYEVGLRKVRQSQALSMGQSTHDGLDLLAKGESLESVYERIIGNYESLIDKASDEDHASNLCVDAEICFRLLQGYVEHWKNSQVKIVKSEIGFDVIIENPESTRKGNTGCRIFRRAGKIDKIVEYKGRLAIMEHKTTSKDIGYNSDYWKHLRIDPQITGYMLGAQGIGFQVETILYDVIRKPAIRPKKLIKKDLAEWQRTGRYYGEAIEYDPTIERETPRLFGARLIHTIRQDPERHYQRQEIARGERDFLDYMAEVWMLQKQIRQSQLYDRWYRNASACLEPYRCEYAELCLDGFSPAMCQTLCPEGYEIIHNVHPELERGKDDSTSRPSEDGCNAESINSEAEYAIPF